MKLAIAAFALYWWLPAILCIVLGNAWRIRRLNRALVFSNLDDAYEGGQFEPDGYLYGATADDLANDLTLYAEDCSGKLESELLPHVRAWMRARA